MIMATIHTIDDAGPFAFTITFVVVKLTADPVA